MKRWNALLLMVLIAAVGLFGCYYFWIHARLDTTGPVISIEEGILEISVEDPQEALLQGIRAEDDRDGDVTASILVESVYGISEENLTTVTYAAFDHTGNVSKAVRQVKYKDYAAPRFVAYGALVFPSGNSFDLMDYVGAEDVLEGDIRRRVHATLISDTKNISQEGTHQIKLQVTNSLGDTAEMVLPVLVYSQEWYSAGVELTDYLIYLERGAAFKPENYLKTFLFRGDPIDISRNVPAGIEVEIEGTVQTGVPGVYEVTYIVSRTLGNTSHSGISKLIVVVE